MTFPLASLLAFFISSTAMAGQIAFIGDSLSTGGAAHPQLMFEAKQFRQVFEGVTKITPDASYFEQVKSLGYDFDSAPPPLRLDRSYREYQHPVFWFADNLWTHFSSQFLDAEEYAWAYLLSRKLGYDPQDVLITARDGEKMNHSLRQVDRLLEYTNGVLPEKVFIFFSGNDLCGSSLEYVTSGEDYEDDLLRTLRYLKLNGKPSPQGTKVFVMNPIGVLQVITASSIQNRMVPYHGNKISCKELHTKKPGEPTQMQLGPNGDIVDLAINMIANSPVGFCQTLFSIHGGDSQIQITLSNRISQYRKGIKSAVKTINELAGTDIRFYQVEDTKDLLFEGKDIANDCFHLSMFGHDKIVRAVESELKKKATL